jgi:hypothetical protein
MEAATSTAVRGPGTEAATSTAMPTWRAAHGVYQIGLVQTRSWIVAGTPSSSGNPYRTAS